MIEFDRVSLNLGSFSLDDVSLTIGMGDYYFIVGPSGAGKTVLLEVIAGLHRPDSGRVLLRGTEITTLPPEKRGIALVYQDYSLFPNMTVVDNVSYGLRVRGMRKNEARAEVVPLLERFGIGHLADRYPGSLSGGEQQRVALARAIAVKRISSSSTNRSRPSTQSRRRSSSPISSGSTGRTGSPSSR